MRKFLIGTIGLCILSGCGLSEAARDQPNVLIVVLDALRADHVGCYGYERNTTPNIDAFARKAVVYRNAYSTTSWTKPSVTSLLTGLNCQEHGVQTGPNNLSADLPYLPAMLKERGYTTGTAIHSCFMMRDRGYARGYDWFWHLFPTRASGAAALFGANQPPVDPDDAVLVNQAIHFIQQNEEPWFAYLHLIGPHEPYRAYIEPEHFGTTNLDLYDAKLRYADAQVGRLLSFVPKDTIVIITADHGEEFGEHGGWGHARTLYDEVIHVPLLIKWPGRTPRVETNLVGLDRIAPALLAGSLPETGGQVHCNLAARKRINGEFIKHQERTITEADIETNEVPEVDTEALRREQLEALGYS